MAGSGKIFIRSLMRPAGSAAAWRIILLTVLLIASTIAFAPQAKAQCSSGPGGYVLNVFQNCVYNACWPGPNQCNCVGAGAFTGSNATGFCTWDPCASGGLCPTCFPTSQGQCAPFPPLAACGPATAGCPGDDTCCGPASPALPAYPPPYPTGYLFPCCADSGDPTGCQTNPDYGTPPDMILQWTAGINNTPSFQTEYCNRQGWNPWRWRGNPMPDTGISPTNLVCDAILAACLVGTWGCLSCCCLCDNLICCQCPCKALVALPSTVDLIHTEASLTTRRTFGYPCPCDYRWAGLGQGAYDIGGFMGWMVSTLWAGDGMSLTAAPGSAGGGGVNGSCATGSCTPEGDAAANLVVQLMNAGNNAGSVAAIINAQYPAQACVPYPSGSYTGVSCSEFNAVPVVTVIPGTTPPQFQVEWVSNQRCAPIGLPSAVPCPGSPVGASIGLVFMAIANQFTDMMMAQAMTIGQFFDAKHQIETQQLFQKLNLRALKDYQPSTGVCAFGTLTRSLMSADRRRNLTEHALNERLMQRQLASMNVNAAEGPDTDRRGRLEQFKNRYCDRYDNNAIEGNPFTGLGMICNNGPNSTTVNKDIDYRRTILLPRNLDIDFNDGTLSGDEQDILALSSNLFSHDVFSPPSALSLKNENSWDAYHDVRSVAAKRSVALNAFDAVVSMKSGGDASAGATSYQRSILTELGIGNLEIDVLLGSNPSYYAQMELLSKRVFQRAEFYVDLYDKPVNVKRRSIAMQAIGLMLHRDMFESYLRSEAVLSVLLETKIMEEQTRIENNLNLLGAQAP